MHNDRQLVLLSPSSAPNPYLCEQCGRADTDGTYGPRMMVDNGIQGLTEWHDNLWYCAKHSAELWGVYLAHRKQRAARMERIRLFRAGQLDWQLHAKTHSGKAAG